MVTCVCVEALNPCYVDEIVMLSSSVLCNSDHDDNDADDDDHDGTPKILYVNKNIGDYVIINVKKNVILVMMRL